MPLYEYECDACGHRFERIQKFSDPPIDKCPVCGGSVRKLISSPAIQFKGSGWYVTDYARKSESSDKSDKADSSGSSGSSSSAPAKTEGGDAGAGKDAAKDSSSTTTDKPKQEAAKPAAEKATPGSKS